MQIKMCICMYVIPVGVNETSNVLVKMGLNESL